MKAQQLILLGLMAGCGSNPKAAPRVNAPPPMPTGWTRTPPPKSAAPLPAPAAAKVTERVLGNGLRVVVVEHHRRPIVAVRTIFNQGAAQDDKDAIGSTFFAVSLLGGYYEVDEDGYRKVEADSFGP